MTYEDKEEFGKDKKKKKRNMNTELSVDENTFKDK